MATSSAVDIKAAFDLQYATLCEVNRSLLENGTKVAGFLLLAIGWVATMKDRSMLATQANAELAAIAVAAVTALSLAATWRAYRVSQLVFRRLLDLDYLPRSCFELRRVDVPTLLIFSLGNGIIGCLLIALLLNLASTK